MAFKVDFLDAEQGKQDSLLRIALLLLFQLFFSDILVKAFPAERVLPLEPALTVVFPPVLLARVNDVLDVAQFCQLWLRVLLRLPSF